MIDFSILHPSRSCYLLGVSRWAPPRESTISPQESEYYDEVSSFEDGDMSGGANLIVRN